jgi:hypothetical protein
MTDQELIEAVAVEVMGYETPDYANLINNLYWKRLNGSVILRTSFDPINNANHWMMVVNKIQEMNLGVEIYFNLTKQIKGQGKCYCKIYGKDGVIFYNGMRYIWQDSPGKAVCLAALEAVRGSK